MIKAAPLFDSAVIGFLAATAFGWWGLPMIGVWWIVSALLEDVLIGRKPHARDDHAESPTP